MSEQQSENITRIALGIEYDGSRFCGWQMQSHGTRTVQQEIEKALSIVADSPVQVICAGRTDTGVHASQYFLHFDFCSFLQKIDCLTLFLNNCGLNCSIFMK